MQFGHIQKTEHDPHIQKTEDDPHRITESSGGNEPMCKRLFCLIAIVSFSLSLSGQVNSDQTKANIDPAAMAALDKMGTFLRTLTVFQVKAAQTRDDVWDNGQAIQSSQVIDLLAARPNRLRAQIKNDDTDAFFLYDGKNFTVYGQLVNYYATVPAPPTIAELIGKIDEKYGIEMPLVDLFMWGSPQSTTSQAITSAIDIGPGTVEGTTCEQYAFRQAGLDWQIWIQLGAYPLPRKLILTTTDEEARPRFTQVLTWNLAPSFNDEAFTFDPPKDAQRIAIAEIPASPSNEKKPEQGGVK